MGFLKPNIPNSPGSFPVTMEIQAGEVTGGSVERSGQDTPAWHILVRWGILGLKVSNARLGGTESNPISTTLPMATLLRSRQRAY